MGQKQRCLIEFVPHFDQMIDIEQNNFSSTGILSPTFQAARTATASIKSFQTHWRKEMFLSITYDNGSEFTNHGDVSGYAYFCDPRSPWQKGTVENTIGRLRRDMPRKTTRTDYSDTDFDDIFFMHNNTPRKCLGFKTPAEAFLKEFNRVALGL